MWVFMLGFLGFPLTGGFIGKFYVFAAAYEHGWWWLIVAGVIATMISAYYYLGVVRAMYFRDAAELQLAPAGGSPPRELVLGVGVAICLVVTVGSFFAVQPLIDVAQSAARVAAALEPRSGGYGLAGARARARRRSGATAATHRLQREDAEAADERRPAERRQRAASAASGERAAHESDEQRRARRAQRSAWRPPTASSRSSRYAPNATSAATAANGIGAEQRVEREAVRAVPVGERRSDARAGPEARGVPRPHSFAPGPDGPSMLNELADERSSHGNTHLARARVVPARHRRRQAHLRRPVPQATRRRPTPSASPSASTRSRVTHGHGDHVGDAVALSKKFRRARSSRMVELNGWLGGKGANVGDLPGFNKGGTLEVDGVRFTLTNAFHSRARRPTATYTGEPAGFVIRFGRQVASTSPATPASSATWR